jgi:sulfur-oxidizing protein SoxX
MTKTLSWMTAALAAVVALAGCTSAPREPAVSAERFDAMLAAGFQANGPVSLERLKRDETQAFCSDPAHWTAKEAEAARARIEAANMATIKWPADGKYLGDWKQGEAIAQSGRGLTWTDDAKVVNGGNCYNCHQIDKKEISHGTIGPSLWNYGKLRGVANPAAAASEAIVKYTWGKIWNAKAYNACSNMPRAGHMGILNEQQIRHLMALLLDPASPVNQ